MDKKIIRCEIELKEPRKVIVQFDDMEIKTLFRYYSDEIQFTESDFIGKTEKESRSMFFEKDKEYLQT